VDRPEAVLRYHPAVSTPAATLRLLFISNLWPPTVVGGAERYAHDLSTQLIGRGHEVKVVSLGVPGPEVVAQVTPWPYRPDAWRSQSAWRRWLYHIGDLGRPGVAATIRRASATTSRTSSTPTRSRA